MSESIKTGIDFIEFEWMECRSYYVKKIPIEEGELELYLEEARETCSFFAQFQYIVKAELPANSKRDKIFDVIMQCCEKKETASAKIEKRILLQKTLLFLVKAYARTLLVDNHEIFSLLESNGIIPETALRTIYDRLYDFLRPNEEVDEAKRRKLQQGWAAINTLILQSSEQHKIKPRQIAVRRQGGEVGVLS